MKLILISLLVIAIPTVLSLVGGWLMLEVAGRHEVQREAKREGRELESLAMRLRGYDVSDVKKYWDDLGPKGQVAERKFLKIDLLFALCYSAAFAFSIMSAWTAIGGRFNAVFVLLLAPVVIVLFADWIETYIQLTRLNIYSVYGDTASLSLIGVASCATVVKIWSFVLSSLVTIGLAITVMVVGSRTT